MATTVGLRIQTKLNILAGTLSGSTKIDQSQTDTTGSSNFGDNDTQQEYAQTFIPAKAYISSIVFQKGTNIGSPVFDVDIQIQNTTADRPNGTVLATETITAASWDTYSTSTDITIDIPLVVTPGEKYAIVFVPSAQGDASNARRLVANTPDNYSGGQRYKYNGSTWNSAGGDLVFKTLYGVLGGLGFVTNAECLDVLNGTTGATEQDGWNTWASTSGLRIQDAANVKASTSGLRVQDAVNEI